MLKCVWRFLPKNACPRLPRRWLVAGFVLLVLFYGDLLGSSGRSLPTPEFDQPALPWVQQAEDRGQPQDLGPQQRHPEAQPLAAEARAPNAVGAAATATTSARRKTEREILHELESQMPNVPITWLDDQRDWNWRHRKTPNCAHVPQLFELHLSNTHWQHLETKNGSFYFYRAYLDTRPDKNAEAAGVRGRPVVRMLAMADQLSPQDIEMHCQFWYPNLEFGDPTFSRVYEYKYLWVRQWGNYKPGVLQPYLVSCPLPEPPAYSRPPNVTASSVFSEDELLPIGVSVAANQCDRAPTMLKLFHETPPSGQTKKGHMAVCVKGMDFPTDDLTVKLAEWIEVLNAFGAEKIFLYEMAVHPNVKRLLNYYVSEGVVDLSPLTLPGPQPNSDIFRHLYLKHKVTHKRQNEVIPYNDCLYRNLYRYDYVALLDIDEVIMPLVDSSWRDMIARMEKDEGTHDQGPPPTGFKRSSYCFLNVYFFDDMLEKNNHGHFKDIPEHMHILQHVYRSTQYNRPGTYVKCLHSTDRVKALHNHFPLGCLGPCSHIHMDTGIGHMQHYRDTCVEDLKKVCDTLYKNSSVKDDSVWRFKDRIIDRTNRALRTVGVLKN